jgi:hypothetical protein
MDDRDVPDPAELASQATAFVKKAASVLEKEVAAGIAAAQSLQKRWVDVDEVRSRAPDEVMQRFRRDAHEVVDLLMDLVTVGVQSAESIASRAVEIANTETQPADPAASPPKGQKQNRKPA